MMNKPIEAIDGVTPWQLVKSMVYSLIIGVGCLWACAMLESCASAGDVPSNTISAISESATFFVLQTQVKESERKEVAAQVYAIASGIRSLSGGTAPTVDQVKGAILAFGSDQTRYAPLSRAVGGLYADFYKSNVSGDTATALRVLESIASGIEAGAASIENP